MTNPPPPPASAMGWRPIAEAPKNVNETIIFGFTPDEEGYSPGSREGYWSEDDGAWRLTSDPAWQSNPQPTHYMELPSPPEKAPASPAGGV